MHRLSDMSEYFTKLVAYYDKVLCIKQCLCDFSNDLILKKLNAFISQTC